VTTCRQHDIYAAFIGGSAIVLPAKLLAPGTDGAPFLHNALAGDGPTPTYTFDSTVGCNTGTVGDSTIEAPKPVTSTDVCGTAGDKVILPTLTAEDHYTYSTVDHRDSKGVGTVVVTAVPNTGYVFDVESQTAFTLTFQSDVANSCVTIDHDPVATPQTCSVDGTSAVVSGAITVTGATGLSYRIHKDDAPAIADVVVTNGTTKLPVGHYTVTASLLQGFTFAGTVTPVTTLVIADQATDCQLATHAFIQPSVSWNGQSCTNGTLASGFISIDPADGLSYFVGGTQLVSAKTDFAPGTYMVNVVAQAGDSIDGPSTIPLVITPSASCGHVSSAALSSSSLGTLAFTGFTGGSTYIIAASLLLLVGAAFVFAATRRRSDDEI
jgi:hypothetical protein